MIRNLILVAIGCIALPACVGTTPPGTSKTSLRGSGQPGSSFATAINVDSVSAEYDWVRSNMTDWDFGEQVLSFNDGKAYDIIRLRHPDREEKLVCFDISSFFGTP